MNWIPYSWKRRAVEPVTRWDYFKAVLTLIAPLLVLLALVLLFGCAAGADELPSSPKPKPETRHRFYDRSAKVELGTALVLAAADSAQTCHNLSHGGREEFLPYQRCAPDTAIMFGVVAAQEGAAYLLHRVRWHRAERLIRLFSVQGNVRGIVHSARHGAL